MTGIEAEKPARPLVVLSHVTPWGFLVALPLALLFAYLGAAALDTELLPHDSRLGERAPLWVFSLPLLAFALFLFLIGVGELASWLKPGIALVIDDAGVASFGIVGQRRIAWGDVAALQKVDGGMELVARSRREGGGVRHMRIHFNRLDIEPLAVARQILAHRPDLAPSHKQGPASAQVGAQAA